MIRLSRCVAFVALIVVLASCHNRRATQKSGTYLETDKNQKSELVTYVSPEEYERMTPAERERIHAEVGAEVSAQLWGKPKPNPRDVPQAELDEAMTNANRGPAK